MKEFEIIKTFFQTQRLKQKDVTLGIGDDCAIVNVPPKHQLAMTTDTLVAGVHFPESTSAHDIGHKSLAVNLSDLAAMGATPSWFTLAITLPKVDEQWLQDFCKGLFTLAEKFQTQLIGGDLTCGNQLTITLSAYGFLPQDLALRRDKAKVGDLIFVTNTLGDAALGLALLQKRITLQDAAEHNAFLIKKLNLPEPQIEIGKQLLLIAHAAIDISDGLAADLTHILEKSSVGATLYVDELPLSNALCASVSKADAIQLALNGGDDYELCFTIPPEKAHLVPPQCTHIGIITSTQGLHLQYKNGEPYFNPIHGYQHFA
jgi:thiamine-monophosphate kinase